MDQRLSAARYKAYRMAPYLATSLWSLVPIEKPGLGTMAVNERYQMFYDPEVLDKWSEQEVAGVLIHEVSHLLRDHSRRAKKMGVSNEVEHYIFNLAADMEINDDIASFMAKEVACLPEEAIYPKSFEFEDGLLAETYYLLLKEKVEVNEIPADGLGSIANGRCGSCADGSGEEDGEGKAGTGFDPDHESISPSRHEVIKRTVAQDIKKHQRERGRGALPAGWARWADDILLPPTIPWQQVLTYRLRQSINTVSGNMDYTYRRRNRRQSAMGNVILPGMQSPAISVSIVVDTSGSISDKDLAMFLSEIQSILRSTSVQETTVYSCDWDVHFSQRIVPGQSVKSLKLAGGGGTSMRTGVLHAIEKSKPSICICFTDGGTDWPEKSELKGTPVIWVLTPDGYDPPKEVVGKIVRIDAKSMS